MTQFANDANREIVNYDASIPGLVWPFMQDNCVGTLTAGELRYDFETNWQRPVDMTLIAPDASAIYPTYMEYEQYRQKYTDPTAATQQAPQVWTTWGRSFLVGPGAPDQAYTLDMAVVRLAKTLTDNGDTLDVPDEWAEAVVLGMFRRCLQQRRRYDQAQDIAQDWDLVMSQMVAALSSPQRGVPTHMQSGFFRCWPPTAPSTSPARPSH